MNDAFTDTIIICADSGVWARSYNECTKECRYDRSFTADQKSIDILFDKIISIHRSKRMVSSREMVLDAGHWTVTFNYGAKRFMTESEYGFPHWCDDILNDIREIFRKNCEDFRPDVIFWEYE